MKNNGIVQSGVDIEMKLGEAKFSHIFQQAKIGTMTAKNRVKYAACSVSNFNTLDGCVTEREFGRMVEIAKTGAGIITNQGAYPDSKGEGKAYSRQLCISDDSYIPGLRRIADLIHEYGGIAIQQILHGGRMGGVSLSYCVQPSAVPQTLPHFKPPREMTRDEIKQCVKDHAEAAQRAIEAGFDGVEITSFMGYLLANFNSKFTNKRTDEYGGTVENRGRFMCETIEAVRDAVGKEHLFAIRLNGAELMEEFGGDSEDECLEFMKMAEKSGVDCISIVVGWHESRASTLGRDVPSDQWLYLAECTKKVVKVPLAFGPRFGSPRMAEKAIAEGKIDFWEVCRPLLADPQLLTKVADDRLEEVKPCIGCLICLARLFRNLPYICTVNPRLGHEVEPEYQIFPAAVKKKIMVIGGGPAGIECAITAAQRGHEVSLYEKRKQFGGQLIAASREQPGGYIFMDLVKYYGDQLKKFDVSIRLQTEVTSELVRKVSPDVVVVATGAYIDIPKISGSDMSKVVNAQDVLERGSIAGEKVLVWGGRRAGLVAAEYLAAKGKQVSIVEESKRLGDDVIATFKWRHAAWVKELKINALTGTRVKMIGEGGVTIVDSAGKEAVVPTDIIVAAAPRKPRQELIEALEFLCDELYVIGDALMPRSLHNAIHEGFRTGVRI